MPQYLRIAEKVYKHFEKSKKFNTSFQDCLNMIIKQLREELKDTDLKLLYNYIDFVDGFHCDPADGHMHIDISLVPNYKNKDEFILWLASFIEKNTEGGVKRIPPVFDEIPPEFSFENNIKTIFKENKKISFDESNKNIFDKKEDVTANLIDSYFKSDEYKHFKNH